MIIKKNNVQWLNNNTKIHYSVERLFTRYGEFNKTLVDQEGAFVDILRVVSLGEFFLCCFKELFVCRCFEQNLLVLLIQFFIFLVEIMHLIIRKLLIN